MQGILSVHIGAYGSDLFIRVFIFDQKLIRGGGGCLIEALVLVNEYV